MNETLSCALGQVVQSNRGRDRGMYFIVLENADPTYVMIADGLHHRLCHPKKKKRIHLLVKPVKLELSSLRKEGGPLQDSDLRRALEEMGFPVRRSLCKEG